MAVTAKIFSNFILKALNKEIQWLATGGDEFKVMLCTSATFTVNQDTNVYLADITPKTEVASGNGYTTGGAVLASKTIGIASRVLTLDAADVTWSNASFTARYAIIYDNTPVTNKPVLGYVDFGADLTATAGNFTITWNASGIATITVAA